MRRDHPRVGAVVGIQHMFEVGRCERYVAKFSLLLAPLINVRKPESDCDAVAYKGNILSIAMGGKEPMPVRGRDV